MTEIQTIEQQLEEARKSLQTFVDESAKIYKRAEKGKRTSKDIEQLADAHAAFREWAIGWLKENGRQEYPLEESFFWWSQFSYAHPFLKDYVGKLEYEYAGEADAKMQVEDGEIAFDTGQTMRKVIFGIYGGRNDGTWKLQADQWDPKRRDCIGCATIRDWEWEQFTGEEDFDKDKILEAVQEDIAELECWLNHPDNQ